jgi:hypothetical protein
MNIKPTLGADLSQAIKKKGFDYVAMMLIGFVALVVFEPLRTFAQSVIEIPARLASIEATQSDILADVDRLKQPDKIFELSATTAPVLGFVTGGAQDVWRLRMRKTREGEACEVVAGGIRFFFFNPRTNEPSPTRRIDDGDPGGVGRNWSNIDAVIYTPTGLLPDAELCVEKSFIGCPGQRPDDPPIVQDPECVPVSVMAAAAR